MRVLVLMHSDLVPPDTVDKNIDWYRVRWETEYNVLQALQRMRHKTEPLGVKHDLRVIRNAVESFKPQVVFNLLEEFDGEAIFDQNVVSYLELLRVPYTGCNPRGLVLARDKALTKKVLAFHRIKSPPFQIFPTHRRRVVRKRVQYPLIVKCLYEEASLGLSQASIVHNDAKLEERVRFIHTKLGVDAIAEEFVEGREFSIGLYGNHRITTLPVWELRFTKSDNPERAFYSERAKYSKAYRDKHGITTGPAKLDTVLTQGIQEAAKRTFRALNLNGYARIDLRVTREGIIHVLEVNPNPVIARDDEFALAAKHAGISYHKLLGKLLNLARSWKPV